MTLLEAMLPGEDPAELFGALRALPFVELGTDGLSIHDTVRVARPRCCRPPTRPATAPTGGLPGPAFAWRWDRRAADLWRYTADMLYLVENPIVRDAFFPPGAEEYAIEPARAADARCRHGDRRGAAGPEAAALVDAWWRAAPTPSGSSATLRGWCRHSRACASRGRVVRSWRSDPVIAALLEHLRRTPLPRGQRVLFTRHALATRRPRQRRRCGSTPSAPISSFARSCDGCTYPGGRRPRAVAVLAPLGFAALPCAPVQHRGGRYCGRCSTTSGRARSTAGSGKSSVASWRPTTCGD